MKDLLIAAGAAVGLLVLLASLALLADYVEYKKREQYYACVFSLKGSMTVGGAADIRLLCSHD